MADVDDSTARNGTAPDATGSAAASAAPDLGELIAAAASPTSDASSDARVSGPAAGDDVADETSAIAIGDAPAEAAALTGAPDVTPGFLAELTEAMMVVVGKERDRVGAIVDADAETHLAQAKERAASEAEAFRQVADEDVASIQSWADTEVERVRADAERRIVDRKADLDAYLVQHDAVLQSELEGIETAVTDYRGTLQSFLDELQSTGDPFEIADRARSLPRPPALDEVRAIARADALTKIAEDAMAAEAAAAAPMAPDVDASPATLAGDEPTDAATADADEAPMAAVAVDTSGSDGSGAPSWYGGGEMDAEADASTSAIATGSMGAGSDVPATPAIESGEAETTTAQAAGIDARGSGTPAGGGGSSAPKTGWETEHDLAALIGSSPTATATATEERPVGVMDPASTSSNGWESTEEPHGQTAVGTAELSGFGHPNAAVRLIRSVAPWTAPTHRDHDEPHPD